jgi:predicted TIM-barrel fold metal-dependent hydrolase
MRAVVLLSLAISCGAGTARDDDASGSLATSAVSAAPDLVASRADTALPPLADHHVHLLGPDIVRDWRAAGVSFSRPESTYTSVTAWMASRSLAPTSFARLVLVPMAHLYGSEELRRGLRLSSAETRARVERENTHVAGEARRVGALALCAAPVLADYALREWQRCHDSLHVAGFKLHLAASEVDLRDTSHLTRVAEVAALADALGLPILLHLDTQRRGTEVAHVRAALDRVLGPRPSLPVVIAHAGGSGGYGPWTRAVLQTSVAWRDSVAAVEGAPRPLFLDLSAVLLAEPSEGVPATTPAERAQLRADVRASGLEWLLFGGDAPVFHPHEAARALRDALALSPEEASTLFGRLEPWPVRAERFAPGQ